MMVLGKQPRQVALSVASSSSDWRLPFWLGVSLGLCIGVLVGTGTGLWYATTLADVAVGMP